MRRMLVVCVAFQGLGSIWSGQHCILSWGIQHKGHLECAVIAMFGVRPWAVACAQVRVAALLARCLMVCTHGVSACIASWEICQQGVCNTRLGLFVCLFCLLLFHHRFFASSGRCLENRNYDVVQMSHWHPAEYRLWFPNQLLSELSFEPFARDCKTMLSVT